MTQLHRQLRGDMKFNDVKSDTLNLRVSPSFKLALKAAAEHEQRSMVNMLEVLVAAHCDAQGITIPCAATPKVGMVGEATPKQRPGYS